MELRDIKEHKESLEHTVKSALTLFSASTGVRVTEIDIFKLSKLLPKNEYGVKINIDLDV